MVRTAWVTVWAGLFLAAGVPVQAAAWRFQWQPGQVLNYKVEQSTQAAEVVDGKKTETASKLRNVKRWRVLDVDAAGVATLELSLASLHVETTTPTGDVIMFDSANPDQSNPQMREQLSKYIGQPLAVLRVDSKGKVVEVKDCKYGPASRFESEPPFGVVLPDEEVLAGQSWERNYQVTLEPPQGTGEKYDATQKYVCQTLENGLTTVLVSSNLKKLPDSLLDQVPLLQMLPEGGVIVDLQAGRLQRAVWKVEKELTGQQGQGSSYQFKSSYAEEYLGDK
ncbi:MAG: hypothetical protein JO112_22570 [Planctomycetes bacterium]|nr:hypothetical protein [Planctomycetota bacterium]